MISSNEHLCLVLRHCNSSKKLRSPDCRGRAGFMSRAEISTCRDVHAQYAHPV